MVIDMIEEIKKYLEQRLESNIKAKMMFLDLMEHDETISVRTDYFSALAREREVQDLLIFIQALEKANERQKEN